MPYRNLPPFQRPWWEKLTGLWMLHLAGMGAYGLIGLDVTTGAGLGQLVFSLLLLSLGLSAFLAWWKGHRDPELVFMIGLGIISLAHGTALWIMTDAYGAQAGLRIIAAGIGTLAWVGIRREFAISRSFVKETVAKIETEDDREG